MGETKGSITNLFTTKFTKMDKELKRTIASYWECECSWLNDWEKPERVYDILNENTITNVSRSSFKLHLRPVWSITELELRELAALFEIKNFTLEEGSLYVEVTPNLKRIHLLGGSYFDIRSDGTFWMDTYTTAPINWLRSKGFCIDKELIDNKLIKWIEPKTTESEAPPQEQK